MRYFLSIVFFLFFLGWAEVQAQLGFFADKTVSCGGTNITFTIISSFPVNKVHWDFGNDRTSNLQNPTVSYPDPGIYTVKLTANDTATVTKTDFIKIITKPDAKFNFRDSIVPDSFIFVFTSAKQPVDSLIYTYNWEFSDTTSASTANLIHSFPREGTYSVSLKVTDNFGCVDSMLRKVVVSSAIQVPNVFTPNNDTRNDVLEIQTNGKNTYLFKIYTRTGVLIYQQQGLAISWEGQTSSGVFLDPGIFYYTLECTDPGNSIKPQAGFIYLFK